MVYGHQGKILNVDLSRGESWQEEYPAEFARMFLGGNGFAASLIRDRVPHDSDPLGPENAVVFAVGPLTDSLIWGTSRGHVASISPLTGLFCDSNFGGDFAVAQKRTGFDAICIEGRSSSPAYVEVTEEGALIHDASGLCGKSTSETMDVLQARHGPGAVCACIGPAGERGVLYANVILGGKRPGASGRGGMGAVMGAKNLKAIVVKGSRRTPVFDRKAITRILKERVSALRENTKPFKTYGTPFLVKMINSLGMLGTRNNSLETFDHAEEISGERIREDVLGQECGLPWMPCGVRQGSQGDQRQI